MKLKDSIRRYILFGIVTFIILGLVVAKVLAGVQDRRYLDEETLYYQAYELASQGRYEEASVYINELLTTKPNSEAINYLGGLITANTGEVQRATTLFQKTLDLNPYRVEEPMFMLQFGEALYNSQRFEDAKIVLINCLESGWEPDEFPNYKERVEQLLNSIENMQ